MRILTLSLLIGGLVLGGLVQAVRAEDANAPRSKSARQNSSVVQIVLKNAVRAPASAYVQIRDVADLSGGAAPLRERLGLYDLDTSPLTDELVRISGAQVRYRLLLANIPDSAFRIHGKTSIVVGTSPLTKQRAPSSKYRPRDSRPNFEATGKTTAKQNQLSQGSDPTKPQPLWDTADVEQSQSSTQSQTNSAVQTVAQALAAKSGTSTNSVQLAGHTKPSNTAGSAKASTDSSAEQNSTEQNPAVVAAKECIIKRLPWKAQDVEIRLVSDIPERLAKVALDRETELDARLRTPWPPLGRVHVGVSAIVDGRRQTELPVMLEVHQNRDVITAKRKIAAGSKISSDDLTIERRQVSKLTGYPSSVGALIGLVAARTLETGVVVRDQDISTQPVKLNPVVIKREDRIRCFVKAGGIMTISVSGEALEDGRVGETIKVRNVDSKKIVHGRVINAHEVEISQ